MDEFFEWTSKTFEFRPLQTSFRRQYISHVIVDFDYSINRLLKDFDQICRLVDATYKAENDKFDYPLHLGRFTLSPDPSETPLDARTGFVIESRGGHPYSANRYFSSAAVTTERHLELLKSIETFLNP